LSDSCDDAPEATNTPGRAREEADSDSCGEQDGARFGFHRRPRIVWSLVATLLLTHAGLLAYGAWVHSPTLNEPGHLVAGLSYWQFGRFEVYRVNPPLTRLVAALPVMAAGCTMDWKSFYDGPGARPESAIGRDFVAANGERSFWLFTIARWACIPFSLIGGLFCFLWARELFASVAAGLLALTLWCFEPNVIAHGQLITPDMAATAFGLGAGYFFWRWLKRPTWGRAAAAGLLLGLAELSKMTWVILFGLWPLLWIVWLLCELVSNRRRCIESGPRAESEPRPSGSGLPRSVSASINAQCAQMSLIMVLGLYVLNPGYSFDGTFTWLKDFKFASRTLSGLDDRDASGNRFSDSFLGQIPVPAPRQYLLGMDSQKKDFEEPRDSYLRGEWKKGGWWYYYVYGYWVKTPHGTQLLLATSILLAIVIVVLRSWVNWRSASGRCQPPDFNPTINLIARQWSARDFIILLAPAVAVLLLVSSETNMNNHFRYVLPTFGFVFVFLGQSIASLSLLALPIFNFQLGTAGRRVAAAGCLAVVGCVLWNAVSSLRVYPHSLAYFNELAGGAQNGHMHLLGSNLDWGQDFLLLEEWISKRGLHPENVRCVLLTSDSLTTRAGASVDSVQWEVVSATIACNRHNRWWGQLEGGRANRIGYTMWAFPRNHRYIR
jgi:hypothetical protein